MTTIDLTNYSFSNNRTLLRKELINIFLDEIEGTGKGHLSSKYEYIVYQGLNHNVYLKRPAQFNKGFDFSIHVSNVNFNSKKATTRPTHQNIFDDLFNKKSSDATMYLLLLTQIDNIYNCLNYNLQNIHFNNGLPVDILCETIKWLFAEQDVTYWNYSGRAMFYGGIKGI